MKTITKSQQEKIAKFSSTWSDIDFSKLSPEEKFYWFEEFRLKSWLVADTKRIKEKAGSMFGLVAMVSVGVELLSRFRYNKDQPTVYFPKFLEEYVDKNFKYEVNQPYQPPKVDPREKWFYDKGKLKYSEIFYFGMRNQLMHNFLFRHTVLIEPIPSFLKWERKKKRLLVDARILLVKFEDAVNKYIEELRKAKPSSDIYKNFFKQFEENYERKFW